MPVLYRGSAVPKGLKKSASFEVITAVHNKIAVFYDIAPCALSMRPNVS